MPDRSAVAWPGVLRRGFGGVLRAPFWFALVVVAAYALLTLPILVRHHFDFSAFVVAGDQYVEAGKLASPIIVKRHSAGYDGQFYYRLAVAPFDLRQPAFGVRFDLPPWRMQRIFYPLLSSAAAFGRAALVPAALFLVNLLGLAAIAALAVRLTRRLSLPALTPLAIVLWPGFVFALTHDTTEIVSAALILGALAAYLADALAAYALLGALATLTRETGILAVGGLFALELVRASPGAGRVPRWHRVLLCGFAMVPFLAWREALYVLWDQSPQQAGAGHNVGWPLLGAATMLLETLSGARHYSPRRGLDLEIRAYAVGSAAWLLSWCAMAAARVPAVLRVTAHAPLACAWLPLLALMSVLSAGGPWIDPTAYFRAFSECFVVGCLVAGVWSASRRWELAMFAGGAMAWLGAWWLTALQVG
jgi:hypothetical protein